MADELVKALIDGTIMAQGTAIAAREIVGELLLRFALTQSDPKATLRDMHAAITSRMDSYPGQQEKKAHAEAREYIDLIFTGMDRRLPPL